MLDDLKEIKKKYGRKFPHLDEAKGKIWAKGTSFTAESEDVVNYLASLYRLEPRAPYEFIQNSLDYNHDAFGTPEVWINTTDEMRYSFADFIRLDSEAQMTIAKSCLSIEFNNYLTEGQGLNPQNLIHRAHKGPPGTEGKHGIGSKIAGTALVAGGHASSIEYFSKYSDQTTTTDVSWHGEAIMSIDEEGFAAQTDADFTVAYQLLEGEEKVTDREQTKIIIHNPSETLVTSMSKLPQFLLQTNSRYWNYRLNHTKELHPVDNQLTVFLFREDTGSLSGKDNVASLSIAQSNDVNVPKIATKEKPRVEILSRELLGDQDSSLKNYVYVDGLKLYTGSSRFKFNWSFFGFKDADSRYRVERSSESGFLVGDPSKLITLSLGKCTNEKIFEELIETGVNSSERVFELSNLDNETLTAEIKSNPKAKEALVKAWESFCEKNKLSAKGSTYITDNKASCEKANEEGHKTIYFNQQAFFQVLTELGIAKRLESNVRLSKDDIKNGDEIKIYSHRDFATKSVGDYFKEILLDEVFYNAGKIKVRGRNITINLPYDTNSADYETAFKRANFDGLQTMMRKLEHLWEYYGVAVSMNVTLGGSGGKSFLISYVPEDKYDEREFTIEPLIQTVDKDEQGVTIDITINNNRGEGQLDYLRFTRSLSDVLKKITDLNGEINKEKYEASIGTDKVRLHRTLQLERSRVERDIKRAENAGQQRLRKLEEEAENLRRWLGDSNRDRSSNSPTRRTLRAPNKDGKFPPPDLEKTHTSLFSPNAVATSTCRTDSDPKSQNSPSQILENIETTEQARRFVEQHLWALQNPDIQLLNGQLLSSISARRTLISTVNGRDSDSNIFNTDFKLKSEQLKDQLGCKINRSLSRGDYSVPFIPNSEVIGFYHPDIKVTEKISFKQSSKTKTIEFTSAGEIPPGLEFYYQYDSNTSYNWTPSAMEKMIDTRIINHLNEPWKNLIETVKVSSLSPKQKLDIALSAWIHAFRYNDSPQIDDLFKGLSKEKRQTKIINQATGNCGYASEGFVAICRLLDLPAIDYLAYLGDHDRFYPGNDNHAVDGVYIGNEWVIVDPQGVYLTPGYQLGDIPKEFAEAINQIPKGLNTFPRAEKNTAPVGADAILKRLTALNAGLDDETVKMIRQIQEIEKEDNQIDREYMGGSRAGVINFSSLFGAASSHDFEMDGILKQFDLTNDKVGALDKLIGNNIRKRPIYTIGDTVLAADFLSELRNLLYRHPLPQGEKTTPDELLKAMERDMVIEILESAEMNARIDVPTSLITNADTTKQALELIVEGIQTSERKKIVSALKQKGMWTKSGGGEGSAESLVRVLMANLTSNTKRYGVTFGATDLALTLLRRLNKERIDIPFDLPRGEKNKLGIVLIFEIIKSIISGHSNSYAEKLAMQDILLQLRQYDEQSN